MSVHGGNSSGDSSSSKQSDVDISSEPEFRHSQLLFFSMLPTLFVILAFGGQAGMIVLGFGSIVAYIFDLMGVMEGTVLTIAITLILVWLVLFWSGRLLLQETLWNLSLIATMGILLFYFYIIAMSQFRSLRNEFDSAFYFFEQVIFATLPLFASVVISWFICVEIPGVADMSICFSTIYYVYSLVLLHPRLSSHPNISFNAIQMKSVQEGISGSKQTLPYVLHTNVVKAVYIVPVVLCPVMFVSTHYNILTYGNFAQFISLFVSLILPVLYMTLLIEQQLQYFPSLYSATKDKTNKTLLSTLGTLKLIIAMLLFVCIQDHPLFDDIKTFSGFDEEMASAAICLMMLLLTFAVFLYRAANSAESKLGSKDYDFYSPAQVSFMEDMRRDHGIANVFVTICLCLAGLVGGLLLRASPLGLLGCCVWAVSTAELYQLKAPAESSRKLRTFYALTVIMGLSASNTAFSFTYETLYFLHFEFHWTLSYFPISIQGFCAMFAATMFLASIVPPIAIIFRSGAMQRASSFLPSSGKSDSNSSVTSSFLQFFSYLFQFCVFLFAAMELLIREHNWSDSGATVEEVYPAYLMAGTSILLLLTASHLYQLQLVDMAAVAVVLAVQGCKLLHLAGLPSQGAASLCSLLLNYCLPFALHLGEGMPGAHTDSADEYTASASLRARSSKGRMSAFYFLAYLFSAALSTCWAFSHVSGVIMSLIMVQEPSLVQRAAICLCVYCTFTVLMLTAFYKQASTLRTIFVLTALLALLLAVNALGGLSVTADPTSPVKMVLSLHPEMASESTAVFIVLSLLLLMSAAFRIFPVHKPLPRLLYLLTFTYCSARSMLGWFFPLHMGSGLQAHLHSLLQLPWLYTSSTVLLAASSSIHASVPSKVLNSTSSWLFLASAVLPLLALLYSLLTDTLHEYYEGIFWTAASSNSCVCVLTRLSEVMRTLSPPRGASAGGAPPTPDRSAATASATATVCATSAILGFAWTAIAAVSSRGVYADLAVPAAAALFICTKAGVIVADKPPLAVAAICASGWWLLSACHAILIRGHSAADGFYIFFATSSDYAFGDSDVSIWTSKSMWMPLLNLLMMVVPLPAILLSFARRSSESEDVLFILAVLSCVPVIGAGINSVRLLGCAGTLFASYACFQLSASLKKSQRLL